MVLIQLLLPRFSGSGVSPEAAFAATRAELVAAFGGITAYLRSPAQGAWTNPEGKVERDEMVMVEVVAAGFDRAWWRDYQQALADRFSQREILIRALPIEVP